MPENDGFRWVETWCRWMVFIEGCTIRL